MPVFIKKGFGFFVFAALFVFLCGCRTFYLVPGDLSLTDESSTQGRMVLLSSMQKRDPKNVWEDFVIMKVVATDVWHSKKARALTLIPENSQQIQLAINLTDENIAAKFLTGQQARNVFGLDGGKTYFLKKGVYQKKDPRKIARYLTPTRNYFLWPQIVHQNENIFLLEQVRLGYLAYDKIFVTPGDLSPTESQEQYVVWVNQDTLNIDYIEYNFQDSWGSYRGVVHYREYRFVHGVNLPHQILLLDAIGQKNFLHKFQVQIYGLEQEN